MLLRIVIPLGKICSRIYGGMIIIFNFRQIITEAFAFRSILINKNA